MTCDARQYGDEMKCRCGLSWDANDPDPPVCPKEVKRERRLQETDVRILDAATGGAAVATITTRIPVELPEDLAGRMEVAFHAVVGGGPDAMRAAYRVFLDSLQ